MQKKYTNLAICLYLFTIVAQAQNHVVIDATLQISEDNIYSTTGNLNVSFSLNNNSTKYLKDAIVLTNLNISNNPRLKDPSKSENNDGVFLAGSWHNYNEGLNEIIIGNILQLNSQLKNEINLTLPNVLTPIKGNPNKYSLSVSFGDSTLNSVLNDLSEIHWVPINNLRVELEDIGIKEVKIKEGKEAVKIISDNKTYELLLSTTNSAIILEFEKVDLITVIIPSIIILLFLCPILFSLKYIISLKSNLGSSILDKIFIIMSLILVFLNCSHYFMSPNFTSFLVKSGYFLAVLLAVVFTIFADKKIIEFLKTWRIETKELSVN